MSLARRFIERYALRLARLLDRDGAVPPQPERLRIALGILGVTGFRDGQLEIIVAALRGESILAIRPTGSGKSLCYQVPALVEPGTSYVLSPLKVLMSDQIGGLQARHVPASFINSDLSRDEKRMRYEMLRDGHLKLLYMAPERLDPERVSNREVGMLLKVHPRFLVVDEAHCIDRWGSDFRPSYGRLGQARERLGSPAVLAFTATAGLQSQKRILSSLGIPDARVVVQGTNRPNITLCRVKAERSRLAYRAEMVAGLLRTMPSGHAMIFVPTVKIGEGVQQALATHGFDLPFYHSKAGLPHKLDEIVGRFTGRLDPPLPTVICTNAFGMGIDVSDVRLVVNWQHPASVEDYLQEFGRAGRDGQPALAVLFSDPDSDAGLLRYMAAKNAEVCSDDRRRPSSATGEVRPDQGTRPRGQRTRPLLQTLPHGTTRCRPEAKACAACRAHSELAVWGSIRTCSTSTLLRCMRPKASQPGRLRILAAGNRCCAAGLTLVATSSSPVPQPPGGHFPPNDGR